MAPLCIGRRAASTTVSLGWEVVAPLIVAAITETFPVPQSGSVTRSYWYQTTPTLPVSPAVTHGHSRRCPVRRATTFGALHVLPPSLDTDISTEFASGVCAGAGVPKPSLPESVGGQPVVEELSRWSVSQTR